MQPLNGIIIIDKPSDWTSHDVVARARRSLDTQRIGHTGTLDPFATGVLVLCIGRATRLAQFLSGEDKEYLAVLRLGFATDTGDLTGVPLGPEADSSHISRDSIEEVLTEFRGSISQTPPMYAAKRVDGVRLYKLARRGEVIERKPVDVEIKQLELCANCGELQDQDRRDVAFRVVCSAGTYIRTLAAEIGQRLGVGAHLVTLRRTRAGRCFLDQAVTLDGLAELAAAGQLDQAFRPMTSVLGLPEVILSAEMRSMVLNGRAVAAESGGLDAQRAALCGPDRELLAVADFDEARVCWQPRVVIASA